MLPSVKKSLLLLIILCLTSCENFTTAVTYQGKVVKVLDGDSINILHQGKPLRIRLAEIDAPEYSQPFWKKSKQALEGYVRGKTVEVEEFDVDQYGRVVGHVYVVAIFGLMANSYATVLPMCIRNMPYPKGCMNMKMKQRKIKKEFGAYQKKKG